MLRVDSVLVYHQLVPSQKETRVGQESKDQGMNSYALALDKGRQDKGYLYIYEVKEKGGRIIGRWLGVVGLRIVDCGLYTYLIQW